jgi:hypothetical protein
LVAVRLQRRANVVEARRAQALSTTEEEQCVMHVLIVGLPVGPSERIAVDRDRDRSDDLVATRCLEVHACLVDGYRRETTKLELSHIEVSKRRGFPRRIPTTTEVNVGLGMKEPPERAPRALG